MVKAILGLALCGAVALWQGAAIAQNAAMPAPAEPASAAPGPIAALQQQLKQQGYDPGPVNGVMTEKTERALARYARRAGRPPREADPVRQTQTALQRLGLLAGPADGVVGPATRDAIIRFEASRRLAIDPRVSDTLLVALDSAGPAAGAPEPSTAPTAGPAAPPPQATPEETGRRPLPPGVNPPPIR